MANSIYTDLAMESRELNPDIQGVTEQTEETEGYAVSRIKIETDEAARKLEKPMGLYVTLDAPALASRPLPLFEEVSKALAEEISHMAGSLPDKATV
ncbi:MAG: GPR endopeptidase, partial [Clostridia bacterium]|nr:GPR endopeptidase [Clostridia bacterium]